MVPSSPKVPWRTGKMTSRLSAACEEWRARASVSKGTSEPVPAEGTGGTMTDSPRARTAAEGVAAGSPARRWRSGGADSPLSKRSASDAVTQRPSLVMPMGTTSYLRRSMALRTEAAESSETSCSPLRPPKRMPMRSFFMVRNGPVPMLLRRGRNGAGKIVPGNQNEMLVAEKLLECRAADGVEVVLTPLRAPVGMIEGGGLNLGVVVGQMHDELVGSGRQRGKHFFVGGEPVGLADVVGHLQDLVDGNGFEVESGGQGR